MFYLSSVTGYSRTISADNIKDAIQEAIDYKTNSGNDCSVLNDYFRTIAKIERNGGILQVTEYFKKGELK